MSEPVVSVPPPRITTLAMTGHRPDKLGGYHTPNPIYNTVVANITSAIREINPVCVIVGMALGVDQWSAEICLRLNIPFIAALPFAGMDSKWPHASKAKFNWLLGRANQVITVSPGAYEPRKMQLRNMWMVDNCDMLAAVFDGTEGGTANCISYATSVGKPIHYIDTGTNPMAGLLDPRTGQRVRVHTAVPSTEPLDTVVRYKRKIDL